MSEANGQHAILVLKVEQKCTLSEQLKVVNVNIDRQSTTSTYPRFMIREIIQVNKYPIGNASDEGVATSSQCTVFLCIQ